MQTATPVLSSVRLEGRRLAQLARWSLRAVVLLGVIVALTGSATAAPVVFTASGEFEKWGELSGTITIDTATGDVLAADLQVAGLPGVSAVSFTSLPKISHSPGPKEEYTIMRFESGYVLELTVRASTLVGYAGGPLFCYPGAEEYASCLEWGTPDGYVFDYLDEGSLEP